MIHWTNWTTYEWFIELIELHMNDHERKKNHETLENWSHWCQKEWWLEKVCWYLSLFWLSEELKKCLSIIWLDLVSIFWKVFFIWIILFYNVCNKTIHRSIHTALSACPTTFGYSYEYTIRMTYKNASRELSFRVLRLLVSS